MKCVISECMGEGANHHLIEVTEDFLAWITAMRQYVYETHRFVGNDALLKIWGESMPYTPLRFYNLLDSWCEDRDEEVEFPDCETIVDIDIALCGEPEKGSKENFRCFLDRHGVCWSYTTEYGNEEGYNLGWEVFGLEPLIEKQPDPPTPEELKGGKNVELQL